jgi:HEAT repeat protein
MKRIFNSWTPKRCFIGVIWAFPAIVLILILTNPRVHEEAKFQSWFRQIRHEESVKNGPRLAPTEATLSVLHAASKSQRKTERLKAAWVMGRLTSAPPSVEADLIEAIEDEDKAVQSAALTALVSLGTTNASLLPQLEEKLKSEDHGIGSHAAELMEIIVQNRASQSPPTIEEEHELAMKFVESPVPFVRVLGAYRLAALSVKSKQSEESLRLLLNDPNSWVRDRASVFLKYPNAIPRARMVSAYSP